MRVRGRASEGREGATRRYDDALQTIADGAVYQFDPAIVLALQARARDFERVHEDLANAASTALNWRSRSNDGAGAIDLQRLNALERFQGDK